MNNIFTIPATGYAMLSKDSKFTPIEFTRHSVGDNDILIEILYSGICHSDIHTAKDEWGGTSYPCIPGHEIAGQVIAVGKNVTKFKIGDYAGVGCMVNSCGECEACKASQEQFCQQGKTVYTYNCPDFFHGGKITFGGYSSNIVVSQKFAIKFRANAPLDKVAPLLCAGITTYSPLKFSKIKAGDKVGVAGFGGLGMMALKYAVKMGAQVSVFARNENKKADALALGATSFYTNTDKNIVNERFDLIISTIPTSYDVTAYIDLLKFGGELAIVGLPPYKEAPSVSIIDLVHKAGKKIYGSLIGGIKETQEMLDFSLENEIYPETILITPNQIDEAYEKLTNGSGQFRYVIDMKASK
jgi:uncharacterized zinc-type alcohol dehydrogenase-like protein